MADRLNILFTKIYQTLHQKRKGKAIKLAKLMWQIRQQNQVRLRS